MISQVFLLLAISSLAAASFPLNVEPVYHHVSQPYKFGYDIKDHHGNQYRQEEGTGGHAVKGSYGFTDARGVHRQVNYVADHGGFRAQVKTNEPGTANQNPAAVQMISNAPYDGGVALGGLGYDLGYANLGYGMGYGGYGGYGSNSGYSGYGGYGSFNGYGGYGGYGLGILGGLGYARYGY